MKWAHHFGFDECSRQQVWSGDNAQAGSSLDLPAIQAAIAHQTMKRMTVVVALRATGAELAFEPVRREQRSAHSTSMPS